MKRLFLLLFILLPMLASVQCSTSDNNVIRYTTTDNEVLNTEVVCNANLISNTYADGQGVMVFDKPITKIGWVAFDGCTSLKSITIPNSVTEIGDGAFKGCTSLTSITIPNDVTSIGEGAFYGCTSLTSAIIGNGITKIGEGAFYKCASLESITIPNSVTEIGKKVFYGCTSLKSIKIPNSVTEINDETFKGCTSLKSFHGKFASEDNRYLTKDGGLLAFAPNGLTEYTIPNSVAWIGDNAFNGCTSLKSVKIPNSVTEIGWGAFAGCTSLKSVYCKPTTPPFGCLFTSADKGDKPLGCKIYVPRASVEVYKSAFGWGVYADNIVGYDF